MLKFEIEVKLVVITRYGQVVVREIAGGVVLPSIQLARGEQSRVLASALLKGALGLNDGEWVYLRQVGFMDEHDNSPPCVLYSVEIPEKIPLLKKEDDWVDISELINTTQNKRLLNAIMMACGAVR